MACFGTIMRKYILMSLGVLLALSWRSVFAHANLDSSTPAAGASLASAPPELRLDFSEDLDPSFSSVELLNSQQLVVVPGPGVIEPGMPKQLRLALPPLPNDSYTARWRVRSTIDGHITEGSIPFGVGTALSASATLPPFGTPDPALALPGVLESSLRWAMLLLAALLGGVFGFGALIWRVEDSASAAAATRRLVQVLTWSALASLLVGGVFLLQQAALAGDVGLAAALGQPLRALLTSRSGLLLLLRLGLIGALLLLTQRLAAPHGAQQQRWRIGYGMAAVMLLTFSLQAHAAAVETTRWLAIGSDWLHLLATALWLGGLVALALLYQTARRSSSTAPVPLKPTLGRFSQAALLSVAVLALTGLYSSWRQVGSWELLLATAYGRTLLVKLGLFGAALGVAALNRWWLLPQLRRGPAPGVWLRRTLWIEAGLGALVLGCVGVLTSSAPSRAAWAAHTQAGLMASTDQAQTELVLRIAPTTVGSSVIAVDVRDARAGVSDVPAEVILHLSLAESDVGRQELHLTSADQQRFSTQGTFFSLAGAWDVEVVLRRSGFDDIRQHFGVVIAPATQAATR